MRLEGLVEVSDEVADALADRVAVVALESTLITHGLSYPHNVAAARRAEAAVRSAGAVPATVALHDGRLRIGLDDDRLEALATAAAPAKVSRQNLAAALGGGGWGGTTVSATMIAADIAGIAVFATGGIGGVHRGWASSLDVSADLDELARTPVAVVCAGPKSILDVGTTLEALETRGVPVIAWRSDEVAGFLSRSSGFRAPIRVEDADEAAALLGRHWRLGLRSGPLVCVPLPEVAALPREEVERAIGRAAAEATAAGIGGPRTTPWILARVAELTDGRSVTANGALIEQDASVAGAIAVAYARTGTTGT